MMMLCQKQPLCDCTSLSWDEVTELIRVYRLMRVFDVIDTLDWRNLEGCPKCRSALHAYFHK
ncbi:MAG: (2Fe-2S)-binding protein [Thermoflavifilum sp.]|nr:(2Fe-2S)-binding protein [Thermoflavifilum sp.]MCL6515107.1 (2Fe-2S)-binding protein [Alicyclobacillus sp.]